MDRSSNDSIDSSSKQNNDMSNSLHELLSINQQTNNKQYSKFNSQNRQQHFVKLVKSTINETKIPPPHLHRNRDNYHSHIIYPSQQSSSQHIRPMSTTDILLSSPHVHYHYQSQLLEHQQQQQQQQSLSSFDGNHDNYSDTEHFQQRFFSNDSTIPSAHNCLQPNHANQTLVAYTKHDVSDYCVNSSLKNNITNMRMHREQQNQQQQQQQQQQHQQVQEQFEEQEQFSVEHEIKFTKSESCTFGTCVGLFVATLLTTFAIMSGLHYGLNFFDGRQIRERIFDCQLLMLESDSLSTQLENLDSFEFSRHSSILKQKFNDLFASSRLSSAYIRTDIIAFEHKNSPNIKSNSQNGVIVHFDVRISSQSSLAPSANDIYLELAARLTSKNHSPFTGRWLVDPDSLNVRERRWLPREHSSELLSNPWTEKPAIPGILENIGLEPSPRKCGNIDLNYCRNVLPYSQTSYPNAFGHLNITALERDFHAYYKEIIDSECSSYSRLFLCSLAQPECQQNKPIFPCKEFCQQFVNDCHKWLPDKFQEEILNSNCAEYGNIQKFQTTGKVCQKAPNCSEILKAKSQSWKICDGIHDCHDGSDEVNCDYCHSSSSTLALTREKMPKSDEDEKIGNGNEISFHCGLRQCIPQSAVCDGTKDCHNGADEANCLTMLNETTNDVATQILADSGTVSISVSDEKNSTSGYLMAKYKGRSLLVCAHSAQISSQKKFLSQTLFQSGQILQTPVIRAKNEEVSFLKSKSFVNETQNYNNDNNRELGKNLCKEMAFEQLESIEPRRTTLHGPFSSFVSGTTLVSKHSTVSCKDNEILYVQCLSPKCGLSLRSPSLELFSDFENDQLKNSARNSNDYELKKNHQIKPEEINTNTNNMNSKENEEDRNSFDLNNNTSHKIHSSSVSILKSKFLTKTKTLPPAVPAYPGFWPWHVKIVSNGVYLCEATLISISLLLTQGQCWSHRSSDSVPESLSAVFGSVRLYSGDNREAKSISIVSVENISTLDGSKILKLQNSIQPNSIARPICIKNDDYFDKIAMNKDSDLSNLPCFVTGFNIETDRLESRRVEIVPFEYCSKNKSNLSRSSSTNRTKNTAIIDRLTNRICVYLPVEAIDSLWAFSSASAATAAETSLSFSVLQKNLTTPSEDAVNADSGILTSNFVPTLSSEGKQQNSTSIVVNEYHQSVQSKKITESLSITDSGRHLFCMKKNSNWNLFATETSVKKFEKEFQSYSTYGHDSKSMRQQFRYFDIFKIHS